MNHSTKKRLRILAVGISVAAIVSAVVAGAAPAAGADGGVHVVASGGHWSNDLPA